MIFVYISLPFLIVAGVLFATAAFQTGPWERLSYYTFAVIALLAWGGVAFCYCIYLLATRGLSDPIGIGAGVIVLIVISAAAVWAWNHVQKERACEAAMTFYQELATAEADVRATLIADNLSIVRAGTPCAREALFFALGHDRFEPDARGPDEEASRLATFDLLLQAGLAPDVNLLWQALNDADAQLFAKLVAARLTLDEGAQTTPGVLPPNLAFSAVSQIELDESSPYYVDTPAFRAILETLLESDIDLCARDEFGKTLADRMVSRGLMELDDAPRCG
ncbi:MAG: hypothetical protein AAF563_12175 [Pseudomonadota bacterium]